LAAGTAWLPRAPKNDKHGHSSAETAARQFVAGTIALDIIGLAWQSRRMGSRKYQNWKFAVGTDCTNIRSYVALRSFRWRRSAGMSQARGGCPPFRLVCPLRRTRLPRLEPAHAKKAWMAADAAGLACRIECMAALRRKWVTEWEAVKIAERKEIIEK
jgi:hypothetical protein